MALVDGSNAGRLDGSKLDSGQLAAQLGAWSQGKGPLYRQLATGLVRLLSDGAIRSGTLLPPERRLAERLSVSRGTVVNAYRLLDQQGWLRRVQGRGTIVTGPSRANVDAWSVVPGGVGHRLFEPSWRTIDMLAAIPTALPEVLELCNDVDLTAVGAEIIDNAEPAGIGALRGQIASWYGDQGLATTPEQVVVTSGAQQAISLSVEAVIQPGDVVLVEAFTWPGLIDVVRSNGGRIHAVPMDERGIVIDELEAMVGRLRPRMLAVNPHNHNPTGGRLPEPRRRSLAEVCARYGVTVIEDRVASLLNFDHTVPPPLARHHPEAAHVTIDSISKVTWPGLRVGWIRSATPTAATVRAAKALNDLYTSIPTQLMAGAVLAEIDSLVDRRRDHLTVRASALTASLAAKLPDWSHRPPEGGFSIWVRLPGGRATAFGQAARSFGVSVATSAEFSVAGDADEHVRLPFTQDPEILVTAVDRLALAWDAFNQGSPAAYPAPVPSII